MVQSTTRHRIVIAIFSLLCVAGGVCRGQSSRPNILFLLTDDQRADTIGALSNDVILTPNLDRLAQSGFAFRNAYCMGSMEGAVCMPSRTMIHTGLGLFRIGDARRFMRDPSAARTPHIGRTFRDAGYETFHVSKHGNTPHVLHRAFEHSSYLDDTAERTGGHHGKTAADRAIAFVKSRDRTRPFFAYLGFAGPHDPRVADARWMMLYTAEHLPFPKNFMPYLPFDNGDMTVRDELLAPFPRTVGVVRGHLHDYYACISSIDHHIGRILDALRESGDFENTVIVFSSDHGLAMGSHGLMGKQNLFEHSMKSPLIFAGPGVPTGHSDALAYLHDIFPTLTALAGIDAPADLDGKNLLPVIRGESGVRDVVFTAYKDVQRAVRTDRWKLIRYPKIDRTQLFDLSNDPDELNDLSGQDREKVKELTRVMKQAQADAGDPIPFTVADPAPPSIDLSFFR